MNRVDWVVMVLLASFMVFCFWMGSRSWFFVAGICAAVISAITTGYWLKGAERQQHEQSWDAFLNKMKEETHLPDNNRKSGTLMRKEVAAQHSMF